MGRCYVKIDAQNLCSCCTWIIIPQNYQMTPWTSPPRISKRSIPMAEEGVSSPAQNCQELSGLFQGAHVHPASSCSRLEVTELLHRARLGRMFTSSMGSIVWSDQHPSFSLCMHADTDRQDTRFLLRVFCMHVQFFFVLLRFALIFITMHLVWVAIVPTSGWKLHFCSWQFQGKFGPNSSRLLAPFP